MIVEMNTATNIANPSIHAISLWFFSMIIYTTISNYYLLIEINAAIIRILRVKSSKDSIRRWNALFNNFSFFLFVPKKSSLDYKESAFIPSLIVV